MLDKIQGKGLMVSAIRSLSDGDQYSNRVDRYDYDQRGRSKFGWRQRRESFNNRNQFSHFRSDSDSHIPTRDENFNVSNVSSARSASVLYTAPSSNANSNSNDSQRARFNRQPRPSDQLKNRPCNYCKREGFGVCYHVSWDDCPCLKQRRKNNNDKSNNSVNSNFRSQRRPWQRRDGHMDKFIDYSDKRLLRNDYRHAQGSPIKPKPGPNPASQNASNSAAAAATATANLNPHAKVFKTALVLRVGAARRGFEGRPDQQLKDVRRILTTNIRRQVTITRMSNAKMDALVHQFIEADIRAVSETVLSTLNDGVASDLADAWNLSRTNTSFVHSDQITSLFQSDAKSETERCVIIPRWDAVVHLRKLLEDSKSNFVVCAIVIPSAFLPIFNDRRVDIPIALPRVKNLFMSKSMGVSCGVERIIHTGNAERLFSRCQWVSLLVSTDKRRCDAFLRAFGRETFTTFEQLRAHTRVLKHATYLPGFSGLEVVEENESQTTSSF